MATMMEGPHSDTLGAAEPGDDSSRVQLRQQQQQPPPAKNGRRRSDMMKKSVSVSNMNSRGTLKRRDFNEKHQRERDSTMAGSERRRSHRIPMSGGGGGGGSVAPTTTKNPSVDRRSMMRKSMSLSAMATENSSRGMHRKQQMHKGRSRRHLNESNGVNPMDVSDRTSHTTMTASSNNKNELDRSTRRRRESHRTITSSSSVADKSNRRRSKSASARRKSKRPSANSALSSGDSNVIIDDTNRVSSASISNENIKNFSSDNRSMDGSRSGRQRRSSSKPRRKTPKSGNLSDEHDNELLNSTHHSTRSTDAGNLRGGRRRSSSAGPSRRRSSKRPSRTGTSGSGSSGNNNANDQISQSEATHRTRLTNDFNNSSTSMLSSAEPFTVQQSRPISRRESAKRHGVRSNNGNWLRRDGSSRSVLKGSGASSRHLKGRNRRKSSTRIDEVGEERDETSSKDESDDDKNHSAMQMSVSQFAGGSGDDNELHVEVSVTNDPSSLSPNPSSDRDIYALGVLSPTNLEKQPAAKTSPGAVLSAGGKQAQEVVKVKFIQSGGKVMKVTNSPGTPQTPLDTQSKAKKKLTSLAKGLLSSSTSSKTAQQSGTNGGKKKKRVSSIASMVGSRYQTFAGDDTDHEDYDDDKNGGDGQRLLNTDEDKWKEVDAAIPALEL